MLADALRLKNVLREGTDPSYKTAQRYFAGERVEPETVDYVIDTLVEALVPSNLLLPKDAGEGRSLKAAVANGVRRFIPRWEAFVSDVNSNLYPVHEPKDLPVPLLRLVVLDLGMRWGAWLSTRALRSQARPEESFNPLAPGLLKRVIDARRASKTIEDVAWSVGVSTQTIEAWRTGEGLPTGAHIDSLAAGLKEAGEDRQRLEVLLRVVVGIADLRARLESLCGKERIDDIVEAFHLTAKKVHWFEMFPFTVAKPPHVDSAAWQSEVERLREQLVERAWNVVEYGAACPAGATLVPFLVQEASCRQEVAADFEALPGEWVGRCRYWMEHFGSAPMRAAYLEQHGKEMVAELGIAASDFVGIVTEAQTRMGGFDWKPGPEWSKVEVPSPPFVQAANRAVQAEAARSTGDFAGAIKHWRRAVELQPGDAGLHFKLGGTLHELSMRGRPELMEEALAECYIAVRIDPEFGNARNEIGIILSNMGQFQKAEFAYVEAEPTHGSHAHHWFTRGNNYLALKRYQDAADAYQKAIDLSMNHDHPMAKFWLAATLMALGRTVEAKRLGKKVEHQLGKDPTVGWEVGLAGWSDVRRRNPGLASR